MLDLALTTPAETVFTFGFEELADRLHARVAQINHNLAPDPDNMDESISWDDRLDKPLARFATATAAARVQRRAAAWGATLDVETDCLRIRIATQSMPGLQASLIDKQIDSVLYHSVCADKLTLGAEPLRAAVRMIRDEDREQAERALGDLACTLALTDNHI